MLKLKDYPRALLSKAWEDDQEFDDTPQMRELLGFYELACERATSLSVMAISSAHQKENPHLDPDKILKQAIHWQNVKRSIWATITLFSSDPDIKLRDALYDPFV